MNIANKRGSVLITGASGFIGRYLSRQLAAEDYVVSGVGHGIWPEAESARWGMSSWLNGDITPGNLRLLRERVGAFDMIFHLAGGSSVGVALANPREDFFRTVATTAELLDWMRLDAPEAQLIAVSSAAVYGAGHEGLLTEGAPLNPFSPYGHHKRLMEELCRSFASSYGQRIMVARLFSVYGAGLKKQLLWDLCSKLSGGTSQLSLGGTGFELRDWTEVRDVVRALALLSEAASTEVPVFNIGTGVATPVCEVASLVAQAWTGNVEGVPLGFSGSSRAGDPFSLVADPSRLLAKGFAWERTLRQGVAEYVQWYRSTMRHNAPL